MTTNVAETASTGEVAPRPAPQQVSGTGTGSGASAAAGAGSGDGAGNAAAASAAKKRVGAPAIRAALEATLHPARVSPVIAGLGVGVWLVFAAVGALVPNHPDLPLKDAGLMAQGSWVLALAAVAIAVVWALAWLLSATLPRTRGAGKAGSVQAGAVGNHLGNRLAKQVAAAQKWVLGAGIWLTFWTFSTAKTLFFAPPYLVAPQEIAAEMWNSRGVLADSLGNSLLLLAVGFAVGLAAGLITWITIGWFQLADYWVHPILMFVGPVPALAWVPIVFVLFPSSYSGAVFMIALSVWFPISVLTRSGVLAVPRSYYDVAQTLGATRSYLVFRVALPAALPDVFTGAFMALGASFVSLTVAENFGVNSGLGWFLNWKKSWGDFPGVYAGIIVLIVVCGLLLTLLTRTRGWVLRWEKEITRW